MKNVQFLIQTNICNKYICKYIGNIDENNFVMFFCNDHKKGLLQTHVHLVQNKILHHQNKTSRKRLQIRGMLIIKEDMQ